MMGPLWALGALVAGVSSFGCGASEEQHSAEIGARLEQRAALSAGLQQACSSTGTWAAQVRLPVSWPQNLGLVAGQGHITYRAKMTRDAAGNIDVSLCDLALPSYATRAFVGGEHYQLSFDVGALGDQADVRARGAEGDDARDLALAWVATVGIHLADPFQSLWPESRQGLRALATPATVGSQTMPAGACMVPNETDGFVLPAINRTRTRRARHLFTALRHRFGLQLSFAGCDQLVGEVVAPQAGWQEALQSATLACLIATPDAEPAQYCSELELSLANAMAPQLAVQSGGQASLVRVPADLSCQQLRTLNF